MEVQKYIILEKKGGGERKDYATDGEPPPGRRLSPGPPDRVRLKAPMRVAEVFDFNLSTAP